MTTQLVCQINEPRARAIIAALNAWNGDLLPADREAKYQKMAENPFIFFRGTNHLFWADLAGDERLLQFGNRRTRTWIQGDLHIENFGAFGNDADQVVYNINDFDESVIADYQYDLWRMAASMVLVARRNDLSEGDSADVVDAFAASYLDALQPEEAGKGEQIFDEDQAFGRLDEFLEECKEEGTRKKMLKKWTEREGGERRFDIPGPRDRLAGVDRARYQEILVALEKYEEEMPNRPEGYHKDYFQVKHIAQRLRAGTGSLGVPRYYVLIEGETGSTDDDRILDVKRQSRPTAYHFLGVEEKVEYELLPRNGYEGGDARWHEAAYRCLAYRTDDHLGWLSLEDGFYSVRERSFYKETFPSDELDSETRFVKMARQWGTILATDHARSMPDFEEEYFTGQGQPPGRYELQQEVTRLTEGNVDGFQELVRKVAFAFADQVAVDFDYFLAAWNAA